MRLYTFRVFFELVKILSAYLPRIKCHADNPKVFVLPMYAEILSAKSLYPVGGVQCTAMIVRYRSVLLLLRLRVCVQKCRPMK